MKNLLPNEKPENLELSENKPELPTYYISPSDFAFLYNECKRCYYNKYVLKKYRPKYSMPQIFNVVDEMMTSFYDNKSTKILSEDLPEGVISLGAISVGSKPIFFENSKCLIAISGRIDSAGIFDDGTLGVFDFKMTKVYDKIEHFYFNQLMSYAMCFENPDTSKNKFYKVSKLGLACFSPSGYDSQDEFVMIKGKLEWVPIEKNIKKYKQTLEEVAMLLSGEPPEPGAKCQYCKL